MCGIAGIVNFTGACVNPRDLWHMAGAMKHRGPDDQGVFVKDNVSLAHTRLSIIDLSSAGHQPMTSIDGSLVLTYNGEVYNYIEIREELEGQFLFRTKTDTEVILNAYRRWGVGCLDHFNGMFAFALYDVFRRELFLARDRFGVKPLYYTQDNERFIFASEIAPILCLLDVSPEADPQSIYDYLVFNRTNHCERTFFKGIRKLQHGHFILIKDRQTVIRRWYNLADRVTISVLTPEALKDTLVSAVRLRLRSDVPVGACLSGGLDSSSIVSIILKCLGRQNLLTFSAVYEKGVCGDESDFIDEYRPDISEMYFTKPSADTLWKDLDKYVQAIQEPVPNTSEYAEFKVFELAKKHITVILNGHGADETLSGYLYFFGYWYKELLSNLRIGKFCSELLGDLKNHRSLDGLKALLYFSLPEGLKDKIAVLGKEYVDRGFASQFVGDPSFLQGLYGAKTLREALLKHFEYKFEHHLIWSDRSSMAFSLEARFPFLDYRFVESALGLLNDQWIHQGTTKQILREAMRGVLPEKIRLRQDKVGFETPENEWFRDKRFKQLILSILSSQRFKERGYIDARVALSLFQSHLKGKSNISGDIWKWVHLELWFLNFIERRGSAESSLGFQERQVYTTI